MRVPCIIRAAARWRRLYRLLDGKVEALEFVVRPDFAKLDVPLKEMRLKKGDPDRGDYPGRQDDHPDRRRLHQRRRPCGRGRDRPCAQRSVQHPCLTEARDESKNDYFHGGADAAGRGRTAAPAACGRSASTARKASGRPCSRSASPSRPDCCSTSCADKNRVIYAREGF